tara:strand:+ start:133 stop:966 length:834 start_codon:yes stop_codon:yes gene_type:complete
MNKNIKTLKSLFFLFLLVNCASKKSNDITYLESSKALVDSHPQLDVYKPRKSENNPVVIFIHGGYWDKGNKDIYSFLGRNLSRKAIVTVIPNYTLSPEGNYNTMAQEVAETIKWTNRNISKYNGDSTQIFLMGHSAGGHLIALIGTNTKYLVSNDLIKGIILNDAAALDMYSFLKENPPTNYHNFEITWTKNEKNWKDASPIYHLSNNTPPFLIYVGSKSFPSLIYQNKKFVEKLHDFQPNVEINYLPKNHVAMMKQFFYPWNKHYKEITDFIDLNK